MRSACLDRDTFTHRIPPAEDVVETAQEVLSLTKQRHKPGLGSIVEVTQSEVGYAATQTKRADVPYDYTIAESMLAYAVGGNGQLQIELTMR